MMEINYALITSCFVVSAFFAWLGYKNKAFLFTTLSLAFLIRAIVAAIFETGIKYDFVLDSLGYEYRAWLYAQNWITPDLFSQLSTASIGRAGFYEIFLATIFKVFGRVPLIATLVNCFVGTLTIGLICLIQREFFGQKGSLQSSNYGVRFTALLAAFYPSFIVWSATDIRDPLYYFFCLLLIFSVLKILSRQAFRSYLVFLGYFSLSIVSVYVVLGLREYIGSLLCVSLAVGLSINLALRWMPIKKAFLLFTTLGLIGAYCYQSFFPTEIFYLLTKLQDTRNNFANLRLLDSVARSSFGLDHQFNTVTDFITFLPNSLSHYFFGPFPWEINGIVQLASFLEALAVYALAIPTWRGLKCCYVRSRFVCVLLIGFIIVIVPAQGMVISNMGTIFRHRTLPFLVLLIFSGVGLNEIWHENRSFVLKIKHWWAGNSRSESFGGA